MTSPRRNDPGAITNEFYKWPDQVFEEMDTSLSCQQIIQQNIRKNIHDVTAIIEIPKGLDPIKDLGIWKYEHIRQFCLELNGLYVKLLKVCHPQHCSQMSAFSSYIYLCAAHKNPKECPAILYTRHTLDGASALLNNIKFFPSRVNIKEAALAKLESIYRRVYRIFGHAYYHHRPVYDEFEARTSLCARFTTFVLMHKLVPQDALNVPVKGIFEVFHDEQMHLSTSMKNNTPKPDNVTASNTNNSKSKLCVNSNATTKESDAHPQNLALSNSYDIVYNNDDEMKCALITDTIRILDMNYSPQTSNNKKLNALNAKKSPSSSIINPLFFESTTVRNGFEDEGENVLLNDSNYDDVNFVKDTKANTKSNIYCNGPNSNQFPLNAKRRNYALNLSPTSKPDIQNLGTKNNEIANDDFDDKIEGNNRYAENFKGPDLIYSRAQTKKSPQTHQLKPFSLNHEGNDILPINDALNGINNNDIPINLMDSNSTLIVDNLEYTPSLANDALVEKNIIPNHVVFNHENDIEVLSPKATNQNTTIPGTNNSHGHINKNKMHTSTSPTKRGSHIHNPSHNITPKTNGNKASSYKKTQSSPDKITSHGPSPKRSTQHQAGIGTKMNTTSPTSLNMAVNTGSLSPQKLAVKSNPISTSNNINNSNIIKILNIPSTTPPPSLSPITGNKTLVGLALNNASSTSPASHINHPDDSIKAAPVIKN